MNNAKDKSGSKRKRRLRVCALLCAALAANLAAPLAMADEYSAMWLAFDRANMAGYYEDAHAVLVHELEQAGQQAGPSGQIAQNIRYKTLQQLLALDTRAHRPDRMEKDLSDTVALYLGVAKPPSDNTLNNVRHDLEVFYAKQGKYNQAITVVQQENADASATETDRLYCLDRIAAYQIELGQLQEARQQYELMLPLITPKNLPLAARRVQLYEKYQALLSKLADEQRARDIDALITATRQVPDPEGGLIRSIVHVGAPLPPVVPPAPPSGSADAPAIITNFAQCQPHYPEGGAALNLRGTIKLELTVSAEGRLQALIVKQTSGRYSLDQATFEAMYRCEFMPALKGGKWVAGVIPLDFDLKPD